MQTGKHWKKICRLPTYSFMRDAYGNIRRVADSTGQWIDKSSVQEIIDNAETDISELQSSLNLMLTFFGMDEDEWNSHVFRQARITLELTKGN